MTTDALRLTRSVRRRLVVGAAAVVLVLGVIAGVRWWTHPTALSVSAMEGAFATQPLSAFPARVGYFTGLPQDPETITLRDAKVDLGENTAQFTAEVQVCTPRGSDSLGALMAADDDLSEFCSKVRPARDGTAMRLKEVGGDYLIVTLTPKRPGTGRLQGIEVSYARGRSHLFQRGTQRLEADLKLTVR